MSYCMCLCYLLSPWVDCARRLQFSSDLILFVSLRDRVGLSIGSDLWALAQPSEQWVLTMLKSPPHQGSGKVS